MPKGCIRRLYDRLCHQLVAKGHSVKIEYLKFALFYLLSNKCQICGQQFEGGKIRKAVYTRNIGNSMEVRLENIMFAHLHCCRRKYNKN